MRDKRDVMRLHIKNGIRDLDGIRDSYNTFADGGNIYDGTTEKTNQMSPLKPQQPSYEFYQGQYNPELKAKIEARVEANKPVNTTSEFIFDPKTMKPTRNPNAKMGLEIVSPEFMIMTGGVGGLATKATSTAGKIGAAALHGAGQGAMANMSNLSGSKQNLEGLVTDVFGGAIIGGGLKGIGLGAEPTAKYALQKAEPYLMGEKSIPMSGYKPKQEFWNPFSKQIKNDVKNDFKSEIDWGKWNEEIPGNTQLMKEYNAIEQTSKANGTWMKNNDGTDFNGTPEQFIQQRSNNFKSAFSNGHEKIYRGMSNHYTDIKTDRPLFTGDISNASHYTASNEPGFWDIKKHPIGQPTKFTAPTTQNPEHLKLVKEAGLSGDYSKVREYELNEISKSNQGGVYELYHPKSDKIINIDAKGSDWTEIPYNGEKLPTDFIAEDLFQKNLDYININNVRDPRIGNIRIINPKNIKLKSARGNNGMFDMSNPNIYKSLIPASLFGYGLSESK